MRIAVGERFPSGSPFAISHPVSGTKMKSTTSLISMANILSFYFLIPFYPTKIEQEVWGKRLTWEVKVMLGWDCRRLAWLCWGSCVKRFCACRRPGTENKLIRKCGGAKCKFPKCIVLTILFIAEGNLFHICRVLSLAKTQLRSG